MKSSALRILVTEASEIRVDLSFGAAAAANLAWLVPPPIRRRLEEKLVDLGAIVERARASEFAPGELFSLIEGSKTVRVWLE